MSFCDDCARGVRHEGTSEGKVEYIDGIDCYVATPTVDHPRDKVLLFLTDAFGIPFINNQLLADSFAANGIKTIMPNIFQEPVPEAAFDAGGVDFPAWLARNGIHYSEPRVRQVIAALRAEGITRFAAIGYCYGGRPCFNLAFENLVDVIVVNHPSLLKTPDDFETYFHKSRAPLLINSCEFDGQFPPSSGELTDKLFGDGNFAPGYKRTYWDGCTHGFGVRGDLSNPKIKAGKEGAFTASVEFIFKHL